MSYFVYTPRAGSKVIASGWGVTVRTRPWGEGHTAEKAIGSHDIEACDVVRASAADSGDHWRDEGRRWLRLLVGEAGGAAVDDCGELGYYAPTPQAARAARWLLMLMGRDATQQARLRLEQAREDGVLHDEASWQTALVAVQIARDTRVEAQRRAVAERLDAEDDAALDARIVDEIATATAIIHRSPTTTED